MNGRVFHGGASPEDRARLAAAGVELVDLSANINPYGPHPSVLAAAQAATVSHYPEADSRSLRAAYAATRGLATNEVLAGNGSSELIYLVARAFASGGRVLVVGPTFGEYTAAARAADAAVVEEVRASSETAFCPDLEGLIQRIVAVPPRLVFVCNPNNPTSTLLPRTAIERLTAVVRGVGGVLVVDEAYMDFAAPDADPAPLAEGRLVIRTLTKLHSIPGLRAGFLCGPSRLIEQVARFQPPWPVSAPAEAAAIQALTLDGWAAGCVANVVEARETLVSGLRAEGWQVVESRANFVLVWAADGASLRGRMLERGFVLRDCASFGLPHYVRIAVPRIEVVGPLLKLLGRPSS